jgi:two-component system sensor histidine kinase VicK
MKIQRIGALLIVVFLIGISVVSSTLIRYEKRKRTQDVVNKGHYLVTLIALHSIRDFEGRKRAFFLRTLHEYTSSEGLAYCLIHDHTGNPFVVLDPYKLVSEIPEDIQMKSLYAVALNPQTYQTGKSGQTIYEFAKPIFENGEQTGTVRLGMMPAAVSLFSVEHIGLLATIAFFIFAMVPFVYYGIELAFKPLGSLSMRVKNMIEGSASGDACVSGESKVDDVIESLDRSLNLLREKYKKLEIASIESEAKEGVIAYEKKQLRNILDSVQYGIVITDHQDRVNHINAYMLHLLNKEQGDVIDCPLGEVIENEEILTFVSNHEAASQRTTPRHIEVSLPELAPGEVFQVTASYLSDADGSVIGKVVSAKNVTNEKAAERAKHEFVAHVTHELRAPLTTIKSYNEMLMDGEIKDAETQKEFYNTISEETDRLAHLIEDLLNISRIEMGNLTLNEGLVKTDWLVKDCIAAIEAPAQKKHVTIKKQVPDNYPALMGDKELLEVAIINILGNAVKYTPENRTITFSLREEDHTVIFDVIDQGYGISEKDLPHIFDQFYRAEDPQISDQTGSGLGLATTSEIVQLHGGEIEVQSALGKGTHFSVRLPKEEYQLGKQ